MKNTFLILFALLFFFSCQKDNPETYKYKEGFLPESPVNLEDFNTKYDDYNSTAPTKGRLIPFCFSSNRNSFGENFDIIYKPMNINFDKFTGVLEVMNNYLDWDVFFNRFEEVKKGLKKINSQENELGPNAITGYDFNDFIYTVLYASDIKGNYDIYFTSNKTNKDFSEVKPVEFLNSNFDDLYPTLNEDQSKIFFCSNRDNNNFNIFSTTINTPTASLEEILSDSSNHLIIKETTISSAYDDKCPFIFKNILIFTSNRPGGFGGYDLYYCRFENGNWSNPVNFGAKINTENDEYRPILFDEEVSFTQTMMVFSSNRTGGKGGFDLYFVGIDNKLIE